MAKIKCNKIKNIFSFTILYFYLLHGLSAHQRTFFNNITSKKLRLIYSWKALDFAFPDNFARQEAIRKREFIPGAIVPIDVDVAKVGRSGPHVFVTIPRFQEGVPATLGYIPNNNNNIQPTIVPYPNWERNRVGNCNNLISVFRIKADECGRLWVLDTGKLLEDQVCPPKLVIFDLNSSKSLIYEFPKHIYKSTSLFITPVVDIRGQCSNTFVYIADVTGFQLIVYDHATKKSWSIENNLFYPYPDSGSFTIAGQSFNLMDGMFGLALGPLKSNGDRMLYFHPLASIVEGFVPTSVIRNSSLFENHKDDYAVSKLFKSFKTPRSSQAGAEAMDRNGVLFYGLMSDTAIGCWNSKIHSEYGGRNLDTLIVDRTTLQFASGLKIITASNGRDELWVFTVSFQKLMTGTLNGQDTNFRIQAAYIDELVQGTKCASNYHF